VFASTAAQAADAVAAALAEGFSPDAIGEALSLAANQLLLRDDGRPKAWVSPNKPDGSVHGDSVGVHSCDTIHAWRNLAAIGDRRTHVTSLILAGYQVARDRAGRGEFTKWEPYPRPEHRDAVKGVAAESLLKELDDAIRDKNQIRAAALTARVGSEKPDAAKDVFALFRGYAISEDGALHAEKYFATASDEFGRARAAFKWRQLVALARVTASAYGYAAPGYKEACEVLKGGGRTAFRRVGTAHLFAARVRTAERDGQCPPYERLHYARTIFSRPTGTPFVALRVSITSLLCFTTKV